MSQIKNVSDVSDQKFDAIDTRFVERDTRTAQAADESRISLDAALAAAKEAVSEQNKANALAIGKSELATQKQIDAMGEVMATSIKSLEDKIADATKRLDRGEGIVTGSAGANATGRANLSSAMSLVMLIPVSISVIVGVIALVVSLRSG